MVLSNLDSKSVPKSSVPKFDSKFVSNNDTTKIYKKIEKTMQEMIEKNKLKKEKNEAWDALEDNIELKFRAINKDLNCNPIYVDKKDRFDLDKNKKYYWVDVSAPCHEYYYDMENISHKFCSVDILGYCSYSEILEMYSELKELYKNQVSIIPNLYGKEIGIVPGNINRVESILRRDILAEYKPIEEISMEQWKNMLGVNNFTHYENVLNDEYIRIVRKYNELLHRSFVDNTYDSKEEMKDYVVRQYEKFNNFHIFFIEYMKIIKMYNKLMNELIELDYVAIDRYVITIHTLFSNR